MVHPVQELVFSVLDLLPMSAAASGILSAAHLGAILMLYTWMLWILYSTVALTFTKLHLLLSCESMISGCWTGVETSVYCGELVGLHTGSFISSFDQLIIPAGYLITHRADMLRMWILFFPLSWFFRTYLTFW